MASYNTTRFVEDLLEKTASLPPSFTVHLHLEHWTLNNGSKFLYNNQIASLLDDVRAHRIPVDFLDLFEAAKVPFYDGCMIVELLDYRPQRGKEPPPDKPERTRVVLHPNSETLWADVCAMNHRFGGKWTDRDALEVEARLLLATSAPLCLDPNPHLARVANHIMRVSTPTVPTSLKRKAANLDPAEDETDKARRAKIMSFMNTRQNRAAPNYRMLDAMQKWREKKPNLDRIPTPASMQAASSPTKSATPSITVSQAQSPAPEKARGPTPAPSATTAFSRANGSVTPVPQPSSHQFVNTTPTNSTPARHSPMLPQVYPSVQAATEAAKRTPTPAQIKQYAPSPQLPPGLPATVPAPVSISVSVPVQQPKQNLPTPANATFQPSAAFISQTPRGGMPKAAPQNNGVKLTPQQYSLQGYAHRSPNIVAYAERQSQAHAVMMAQRAAQQNGRITPAQLGLGQNPSAAAPVARSSPMAPPKPLAARSPMPPATQLPAAQQQQIVQQALAMQQQQQQQQQQQHHHHQQQQQLQSHIAQHPQHTFPSSYNPAQLRPGIHGSPQLHLAAAAAQAQAQAQVQGQRPTSAAGIQQQQQQGVFIPPQMYSYTAAMNYAQSQQMTPQMASQIQQRMFQYPAQMNGQAIPQQVPAAKAAATGMQGR